MELSEALQRVTREDLRRIAAGFSAKVESMDSEALEADTQMLMRKYPGLDDLHEVVLEQALDTLHGSVSEEYHYLVVLGARMAVGVLVELAETQAMPPIG